MLSESKAVIDADEVISVSDLSKVYYLYNRPEDRLKQFIIPRMKRLFGKQTPDYFREFWALKNVSFDVRRGETVGIIGRNGSGKSTLLQLIAGILTPTYGDLHIQGRVSALLELGAGFNPEFTGRENIYMSAAILGMSRQEVDERIEDIIAFSDIHDFIDQPVKTYSSGMFVRVAFSTAINVSPDILIVDEALSVGDTAFQQKCLHRIRQLQEQGVSILLVTHSNNILLEYCDRGIFLKHGQVLFDGRSREAVREYGLDVLRDEGAQAHIQPFQPMSGEGDFLNTKGQLFDSGSVLAMEVLSLSIRKLDGRAVNTFEQGEHFDIDVAFRVRSDILIPCFGVQISSPEGVALWSDTTKNMKLELCTLQPGDYRLTWRLCANIQGGRYILAIGIGHIDGGEYKRIHALPYAGYFDVLSLPGDGSGWLVIKPKFELFTVKDI